MSKTSQEMGQKKWQKAAKNRAIKVPRGLQSWRTRFKIFTSSCQFSRYDEVSDTFGKLAGVVKMAHEEQFTPDEIAIVHVMNRAGPNLRQTIATTIEGF